MAKSAKKASPAAKKPKAKARPAPASRIRIRMYRQGVGDCFLVTLPRRRGGDFRMLIDCGVHQSQSGGAARMKEIVADVAAATGGELDLLAITHEHFDHTSGFLQARDEWKGIKVERLWYAWTENENEPLAQRLGRKRHAMAETLRGLVSRARLAGAPSERIDRIASVLGFFGDKAGAKTLQIRAAIDALCAGSVTQFKSPGQCEALDDVAARVYVLGPPKDEDFIKRADPSRAAPETYGLDRLESSFALASAMLEGALASPFDDRFRIPLAASRGVAFFRARYWSEPDPAGADAESGAAGDGNGGEETAQGWRRIEDDWLGAAEHFALQLDSATNNTSLVLAIELADTGEVLLFAADAQVGNWLSWQDVRFKVDGATVTGPDLLARTVFYKVGHHGSHNATLREKGLEQMAALDVAMMPTDEKMAEKVRWGDFPWPDLLEALKRRAKGGLVRSDAPVPAGLKGRVADADPLYYEIAF
jgi:hypothetical protein